MKSLIKRLSAFLVASAMAISSSIAVSAAESNEFSAPNAEIVSDSVIELDTSPATFTLMDSNVAAPAAVTTLYVDHSATGASSGAKYTDTFSMARNEKLVTYLKITGSCHVKVQIGYSPAWSTLIETDVQNNTLWKISNSTLPSGMNVKVTLTFTSYTSSYELLMWGES